MTLYQFYNTMNKMTFSHRVMHDSDIADMLALFSPTFIKLPILGLLHLFLNSGQFVCVVLYLAFMCTL